MAKLKHNPIRHDHEIFLAKARLRRGFSETYEALDQEYRVVGQLLKPRESAWLTQDAVDRREGIQAARSPDPSLSLGMTEGGGFILRVGAGEDLE